MIFHIQYVNNLNMFYFFDYVFNCSSDFLRLAVLSQ